MWNSFQIMDITQNRTMIPERGKQIRPKKLNEPQAQEITPKHIIIKFLKTSDKGKFLSSKSQSSEEQR